MSKITVERDSFGNPVFMKDGNVIPASSEIAQKYLSLLEELERIVSEPVTSSDTSTMDYDTAIKLMKEGKKVKRIAWTFRKYIYLSDGVILEDDGYEYLRNDEHELKVNESARDWVEVV